MGFDEETVARALAAADGNVELACGYCLDGNIHELSSNGLQASKPANKGTAEADPSAAVALLISSPPRPPSSSHAELEEKGGEGTKEEDEGGITEEKGEELPDDLPQVGGPAVVLPRALHRTGELADGHCHETARFGIAWNMTNNMPVNFRYLTIEQEEDDKKPSEDALVAGDCDADATSWVVPESLFGKPKGFDRMRFNSCWRKGRRLLTIEGAATPVDTPISTWRVSGDNDCFSLSLADGRQLYVSRPASGPPWAEVAAPGAATNTSPARRTFALPLEGGYMKIKDGRALYVNLNGSWGCCVTMGSATNKDDARRVWTLRHVDTGELVVGPFDPSVPVALMLPDGRQLYATSAFGGRVAAGTKDQICAAARIETEPAAVRDLVKPRQLGWAAAFEGCLGAHPEELNFSFRTAKCDDGRFHRVVVLVEDRGRMERRAGAGSGPAPPEEVVPVAGGRVRLRAMTFNTWVNGGRSLRGTIDAIAACGADVVCLQESSAPATRLIAKALGLFCAEENATLSRFPIAPVAGKRKKHQRSDGWGNPCRKGGGLSCVQVPVQGVGLCQILVGNCHLCHWPYLEFFKNGRTTCAKAVKLERKHCLPGLAPLLRDLSAAQRKIGPGLLGSLLCGDFNGVSYLDYLDHMGADVPFPCSLACEAAGLEDTYAQANPSHLGMWRRHKEGDNSAGTYFLRGGYWGPPQADPVVQYPRGDQKAQHFERIDFVFASGERLAVEKSVTVDHTYPGCPPHWPSDHRAVLTDLSWQLP